MPTQDTKAVTQALNILEGAKILSNLKPEASLVGLDKVVVCDGPEKVGPELVKKLKDLGWTWSDEYDSWEFYTGHG